MFAYEVYLNGITKENLRRELRTKQCTINILHAMLAGQNTTTCDLNNLKELNNPHSTKFTTTLVLKGKYKIEW